MATWPAGLPAPQKKISITPGDTRVERKLQSGRTEFRRFGDGKPDQLKVLFRLLWAQWETFKTFYEYDLNLGLNWFSASWLAGLGYDAHKAKFLGYPREVVRQGYYVDIVCTLMVQKTIWIIGEDTEWPCATTGGELPSPDHYGYIYGGLDGSNNYLQDCDQYNTDLDIWAVKSDMPSPARRALAASTIGSSGYVYAGAQPSNLQDCDEYTPDTWTSKTDVPAPGTYYLAASTIGISGYVYGGNIGSTYYQDCDQYTPDTWVSVADMPVPARHGLAASTIGSSGYVYGGRAGGSRFQDCDEYTPDTWVSKSSMPSPARRYLAASTIGSSGYIYGGEDISRFQDCDEYTPNTWVSKTNMPLPARHSLAASTIGSSGYIYGGNENQVGYGGGILQDCDEYTPDTWTSKSSMPSPARDTLAASTI